MAEALKEIWPRLQRYARSRLRDEALAEDAVSETLLAALERPQRFDSTAQAAAWLYGVLKHKLADQRRAQQREGPAGDLADEHGAAGCWSGAWHDPRTAQHDPQAALEQRQLMARVQRGCRALPRAQSRAFVMRELCELDSAQVCRDLGVSEGHLWVLIHRARARLRQGLLEDACATGRQNSSTVA